MKPLVSIVIPLYNGSNYIEQAIQSALQQDYENTEILIINDGSTDQGLGRDICLKYSDRIRYFEKPNGGCASALNYGIRNAKGQFISWLSHDDLYQPNKISYQVSLYEKKKLDCNKTIVSNRAFLIDANGSNIFHPSIPENKRLDGTKFFKYLLFHKCVNGCGLLIPKAVFEDDLYFNEDLRFVLDWNLWLKIAAKGNHLYLDGKKLVKNRIHGEQVTAKQAALHQLETHQSLEELFTYLKDKPLTLMIQLYYFAYSIEDPILPEIHAFIRRNNGKSSRIRAIAYKLKNDFKKVAKHIYHSCRG